MPLLKTMTNKLLSVRAAEPGMGSPENSKGIVEVNIAERHYRADQIARHSFPYLPHRNDFLAGFPDYRYGFCWTDGEL
jgi:hypothetical protein